MKINSLPKRFHKALEQTTNAEMVSRVQERFLKLYHENELPENSQLQWHLREHILPGLAFYQLLRADGYSQTAALEKMDQMLECMVVSGQKKMRRVGRIPFAYSLLRGIIKPVMRQYPYPGWTIEWIENSPHAIRFNITSCFYHHTFSKYGAPELTAPFCRTDDLVYDGMSAQFKWGRTETIGRGASHCNFCFIKSSKK